MVTAGEWNGASAARLQKALRLTNEAFAEHLGVATRTVAYWHSRPSGRPKNEMQQLLDTAYERASAAVRDRFARLDEAPTEQAERAPIQMPAQSEEADELTARLAVARTVDTATVQLFFDQTENVRRIDRQLGGALGHLRAQVDQVEGLLRSGVRGPARAALGRALTEAAALAGWEALQRGDITAAWAQHETAVRAARESGSAAHEAHALAQQAIVLVDLGEHAAALALVTDARATAGDDVSPLLLSWLSAAEGEVRAAASQGDAALRLFDEADALLPADPQEPYLPFLFLAGVHLDRWRGHALSRVGDAEAVERLLDVLDRLPSDFVRARASTLVDLTTAYAASGEYDAARFYRDEARSTALRVNSQRQLRRLKGLWIPD